MRLSQTARGSSGPKGIKARSNIGKKDQTHAARGDYLHKRRRLSKEERANKKKKNKKKTKKARFVCDKTRSNKGGRKRARQE